MRAHFVVIRRVCLQDIARVRFAEHDQAVEIRDVSIAESVPRQPVCFVLDARDRMSRMNLKAGSLLYEENSLFGPGGPGDPASPGRALRSDRRDVQRDLDRGADVLRHRPIHASEKYRAAGRRG